MSKPMINKDTTVSGTSYTLEDLCKKIDSLNVNISNLNSSLITSNNNITKLKTLYDNPKQFVLWSGNTAKVGDGTWTWIGTYYSLKQAIRAMYPLKNGFKRTAKIYIVETDNKSKGAIYIGLTPISGSNVRKEYLFGTTWGSYTHGVRSFKLLNFDYDGLEEGHQDIHITPDFATGGNMIIYEIGLLLYDSPA